MLEFAKSIIGLPLEQPLAYRRLRRIRSAIYQRVAPLQVEIATFPEPVPFADIDPGAFRPLRPGTAWGKTFECAWLRITGTVPQGEGSTVLLGIRGEGLVYDRHGRILDSVTTSFQQGDLPHAGGQYREVHHVEPDADGRIELYADVTYNGWILYDVGRAVFHGAYVATRDDAARALYYDTLTLTVLAGATGDRALAAELRGALDRSWDQMQDDDIQGALAELAPVMAEPSTSDFVYSAIGHGHLDMAWLWPLRETKRKAARTYVRALNALDARPDYRYGTSQPQQMAWMKQRHPELFERLRAAVAAGQVEVQGSFWIEPDTNLPSGESLIRQAIVGRRFIQEEFGLADDDLRLCWLPDTFGYSGNLPQILRGTGMDWFQTIKLAWNKVNDFPNRTFRWRGIDGSEVLVHMPPEGDYNSRAAADGLLRGIRQYPERDLDTALLVYGPGDGGGGPGEIHLELLDREARPQGMRGLPRVERRTAGDFFRDLEKRHIEHVHEGELYLETHQGTYTTQAAIKRWNRVLERRLHEAEALAVLAGEGPRARDALASPWREVLLNQFHDIIPGSSIERVNREAVETYERVDAEVAEVIDDLVDSLPTSGTELTAMNLAPVARDEYVRVNGRWNRAVIGPYAAAALEPTPKGFPELAYDGETMTNGLLTLRFGQSGEIVSCLDAAGVEHSDGGLNRLVLHRDPFQFPFNAWDIDGDYHLRRPRELRVTAATTLIDGPRVIRRHVLRGPRVQIRQQVVLTAGSPLVRFETHVSWQQTHKMLRAEFRPARYGDSARCEIQFGHIERPTTERDSVERAQFEVCAHRWLSVEDSTGGFAVLNDSKYGHRAKDGLISLNLLRSPVFPDRKADRGEHTFTYAFRPFDTDELAEVIADGYRMGNPLRIQRGQTFEPMALSSEPGVLVETIKPAEQGEGAVLRLYESLGQPTTTAVLTTIPHGQAIETDMLERALGNIDLSRIEFAPFQIRTIALRP